MWTRGALVGWGLLGFGLSLALASPPVEESADWPSDDRRHLLMVESASSTHIHIAALSPEKRREASEALAALSVSCPFTRAALAAPIALRRAALELEPERFRPESRDEWVALQQRLVAHVAALDQLGVVLPVPVLGDGLFEASAAAVPSRLELERMSDPVASVRALVEETPHLVDAISPQTRQAIELESDRVEAATGLVRLCPRGPWSAMPGHPWRLGRLLHDLQTDLQQLAGQAIDDETRVRVLEMAELMQRLDTVHVET